MLKVEYLYAGVAAFLIWKTIYALFFSPLRNMPGPFLSRLSPLPSLVAGLTRCTNDDMVSDCEEYGSVYLMEPNKVAICHPDDCRLILSSYTFVKDEMYSNVDFMEANIFLTRDSELNKQRRRQVGPTLSMAGLHKMEPAILAAGVEQLMTKWDEYIAQAGSNGKARVCYYVDLTLMSFDIIASIGFGSEHRSLTTGNKTIANWVDKTFALMIIQMVLPAVKCWPLRGLVNWFLRKDIDDFFAFGNRAIEQRKDALAKGAAKPHDILQSFIDAEDPESNIKMTASQVTTESIMMLLSGADTSSTSLAWTIHLLMIYPVHYKLVVDEIRRGFNKDQVITFDMAKEQLPYLEACVFESLRLCPVSTNLPRIIPKGGVTIRGHFIPEGFKVAVSTAAANKNQAAWVNPHLYDPLRFINNEANRRNLMTLSAGVRICPGRHLVMVEMMTTLANLVNRYDFALPSDAIYTPANVDENGLPVIMPRTNYVAMIPKHPTRDCNLIISKRP
ncbi:putative cytochrome P450 monooxygenase [Kickxella alabastrina]|uniref:putative cytochrome P450 monooxygenase n=1 Tax=Kickxella alabastrina TaxID=61397 RepID=UPI00221F2942|nr:putative cytochrome P450 monooxygenase [Kickxella alabastrina]KAI7832895.1 putative cytochrome P450 monooxygenase [Kickxella alabastrina]